MPTRSMTSPEQSKDMKVKIIWERNQDGETEITEYEGHYKNINGAEIISFCEADTETKHLLKITDDVLKWTRSVSDETVSGSTEIEFKEGKSSCMNYITPHGSIRMDVDTSNYNLSRHQDSGLPHVLLDYCLKQKGEIISEYKLCIRVFG